MRIGVIGHRSWIGRALIDRFSEMPGTEVFSLSKAEPAAVPDLDCLYIIPGKVEQTVEEMDAEREMVYRIASDRGTCGRQVLLSSDTVRVVRSTSPTVPHGRYATHKAQIERAFYEGASLRRAWDGQKDMRLFAVRPGAIFGPTQDVNSKMLIPSLIRTDGLLTLNTPNHPTKFISVYDLVDHLVALASDETTGPWIYPYEGRARYGEDDDIPGTFTMTPRQLQRLYKTFNP